MIIIITLKNTTTTTIASESNHICESTEDKRPLNARLFKFALQIFHSKKCQHHHLENVAFQSGIMLLKSHRFMCSQQGPNCMLFDIIICLALLDLLWRCAANTIQNMCINLAKLYSGPHRLDSTGILSSIRKYNSVSKVKVSTAGDQWLDSTSFPAYFIACFTFCSNEAQFFLPMRNKGAMNNTELRSPSCLPSVPRVTPSNACFSSIAPSGF